MMACDVTGGTVLPKGCPGGPFCLGEIVPGGRGDRIYCDIPLPREVENTPSEPAEPAELDWGLFHRILHTADNFIYAFVRG